MEQGRSGRRILADRGIGAGGVGKLFPFLKGLLFSYILTAVMLFLLAMTLYKFGLTEKVVCAVIIVIYVAATFSAGFLTGKKMKSRKFLWGLLMGVLYFVILALVSLVVNQSPDALGNSFFTTLALCAGGGMLGGMLS